MTCQIRGPRLLKSLEIGLIIIVTEHVLTLVVGFILSLGVQTSEYIVDAQAVIPPVLVVDHLHFGRRLGCPDRLLAVVALLVVF